MRNKDDFLYLFRAIIVCGLLIGIGTVLLAVGVFGFAADLETIVSCFVAGYIFALILTIYFVAIRCYLKEGKIKWEC